MRTPSTPARRPAPAARTTLRHRAALPLALAGLTMLGPFTIDTPFCGCAVMSLVHGPLSDALGRRAVMLAGLGVYALASVGCALAPSMGTLLALRALQGLSAGGGVIIARVVVRDRYEGAAAQRLMSRVTMIFGLAPAVAPIVGGLRTRSSDVRR